MDKKTGNAVKRARILTGYSQEKAAEMSGYSVDSIQAWEAGTRRASVEALDTLALCYNAPWLAGMYLRELSQGGFADTIPDFTPGEPLPQTVLALLDHIYAFCDQHSDRRLMAIAADGKITAEERPEFDAIMKDLREITQAAMAVRFAKMEKEGGT